MYYIGFTEKESEAIIEKYRNDGTIDELISAVEAKKESR